MPRGVDDLGKPLMTAHIPATTLRGAIRRAIVREDMQKAAAAGNAYTLQRAYLDLIGQSSESEKSADRIDLAVIRKLRESNPVVDLFGEGLGTKSRLLVSHAMPAVNILPIAVSGVRKDLSEDEADLLDADQREKFVNRNASNSARVRAEALVDSIQKDIRKAEKKGGDVEALQAALAVAEAEAAKHKDNMGDMQNSTQMLTTYFVMPAGVELTGRMVIQNTKPRDIEMLLRGLDALSLFPVLGAQSARGCGEISGVFTFTQGGEVIKRVEIGGFAPAVVR